MPRRFNRAPVVPPDCGHCRIRKLTICQALQGKRLSIVETYKTGDRILPAGSVLYQEGQSYGELYNLLDGWVALHRFLPSGRRQILDFVLPGAFLGYQPNLSDPMQHGAECLTDVAVCLFPRESFPSLLDKHPELAVRLARLQARDGICAHDHITNVGSRPARARIAHLLLELYSRVHHWYSAADGDALRLPITQNDIADALGLTDVHVNTILQTLRADGLVEFRNGWLHILDFVQLAATGEFDPGAISHSY